VIRSLALRGQTRQYLHVNNVRKSVYNFIECLQGELERIYLLNVRLLSRLLMKSVKKECNQASAVRLLHAVQGAESAAITHVRARKRL
jgi:hypothetical protein